MMMKLLPFSLMLVESSGCSRINNANAVMDRGIAESFIIAIPSRNDNALEDMVSEEQFEALDHADANSFPASSSSAQSTGMP